MTYHSAPAAHILAAPSDKIHPPPGGGRLLARGIVIVGLCGIAVVHLALLPDTWSMTPWLGAMFAVLVLAAAINAAALIHTDRTRIWQAAGLVALGPIGGYLLTRSIAVPFDRVDVGNWLQPSGLVALFIEASVLALCCYTLRRAARRKAIAWQCRGR